MGALDMLLEHDPEQVKVVDKDGNGLLHHAKGKQVCELCCRSRCLLNIANLSCSILSYICFHQKLIMYRVRNEKSVQSYPVSPVLYQL